MNMARKPKTPEQMIESACAALREHLKADSIIPVALSILRREYPEGAIVVPDVTGAPPVYSHMAETVNSSTVHQSTSGEAGPLRIGADQLCGTRISACRPPPC